MTIPVTCDRTARMRRAARERVHAMPAEVSPAAAGRRAQHRRVLQAPIGTAPRLAPAAD